MPEKHQILSLLHHFDASFLTERFQICPPNKSTPRILSGERGGGTAGGFVNLNHNGLVRTGVLTNHHVVSRNDNTKAGQVSKEERSGKLVTNLAWTSTTVMLKWLTTLETWEFCPRMS
jgi:hypothetical protein